MWQHAQSLLLERLLVFCQDCVVYHVLEDLDYEKQVQMGAFNQKTVFIISFTVRDKHPKTFHDFAFCDHLASVRLWFVPDIFGDALKQL